MHRMALAPLWITLAALIFVAVALTAVLMVPALVSSTLGRTLNMAHVQEVMAAAQQGDPSSLRAVLANEPGLARVRDQYGWTPLHEAARGGCCAAVRLLVARGAAIDARDNTGATPLHAAAKAGELGAAKLLLRSGADPGAKDGSGFTPSDYAARVNNASVRHTLLRCIEDSQTSS